MLTTAILIPLVGALALAAWRQSNEQSLRVAATILAAVPLALLIVVWSRFTPGAPMFQQVVDLPWIPAVGAGFRLGVDGISLPVATLTSLLFVVTIGYPTDFRGRARHYLAWMLFLESVSLGLFLALDLLLFYVFFDLSLLGMYFLIALWGHEGREQAAIKFILYTFAGSLVMLLGVLSLILSVDPVTFDMRVLIAEQPLAGTGLRAGLTLLALMFGLAVKTPLVPVHTWLPAAHVAAPAPVSAILAGVLLKMGTYGMIRIACLMMPETFRQYAGVIAVLAVISIVYGALVALGQRHIKRRIAYTSVVHMGYTVLGIAIAFSVATGSVAARRLALTGATLEMIAHGLITGALFLICGSLFQRTQTFEMDHYGGVAGKAPWLTLFTVMGAFASLGLPGFAGFVAEFQVFAGSLAMRPWLAGIALVGVMITAALFLQLLQVVFLGKESNTTRKITDLGTVEIVGLSLLLGLALLIGVIPAFVVNIIDGTSAHIVGIP